MNDCYRELIPTGGFTWQRQNIMSRLDMILVSSGKAVMCTGAEVDWNLIDSDHAGVKLWLDVRKIMSDAALKLQYCKFTVTRTEKIPRKKYFMTII